MSKIPWTWSKSVLLELMVNRGIFKNTVFPNGGNRTKKKRPRRRDQEEEIQKAEKLLRQRVLFYREMKILTPHLDIKKLFQVRIACLQQPDRVLWPKYEMVKDYERLLSRFSDIDSSHVITAARTLDPKGIIHPFRVHFYQLHRDREEYQANTQKNHSKSV